MKIVISQNGDIFKLATIVKLARLLTISFPEAALHLYSKEPLWLINDLLSHATTKFFSEVLIQWTSYWQLSFEKDKWTSSHL